MDTPFTEPSAEEKVRKLAGLPPASEKMKNFVGAMAKWATEDHLRRVDTETFQYRLQFCKSCPNWSPDSYMNLGMCKLCGCSVGKLYIPSSRCPDNRWGPIVT